MEFHDQSDYDAPQFVDFQKVNLPEADDTWFDKKESHDIVQPLSVCRQPTTEEPKFVETSPKKPANRRREVLESSETILLRQIQKQREDAEIELKRSEVRKLRAFLAPSYAPIRSEKELTRPIEPVLATELRSRIRANKNTQTKVNPIKKPPTAQKEKPYPPSEPPQNTKQPKHKTAPIHRPLDRKMAHEGATGISWKREQSTLAQPEPFHLRSEKRVHRKVNSDSKNIAHSYESNTHPVTLLEQYDEEQENETISLKDPIPLGAKKGITTTQNSKHYVPCQPKAPLKDTSNSTLKVLDLENTSKKRKLTNLDEEIPSTKRSCNSPTQSTNPLPDVSNPPPEGSNPFPDVSNPLPEVSNPFPEVSNPFPEVSNPLM